MNITSCSQASHIVHQSAFRHASAYFERVQHYQGYGLVAVLVVGVLVGESLTQGIEVSYYR
jgi:hypothetical protein